MSTRISSKVTEDGEVGARGADSDSGGDKRKQNLDAESSGGEEERKKFIDKAIRDNAEFVRLNKKPLQFGIEELSQYNGHAGDVIDYC